jgi:nicotinate-nucleotide pyrophosphorylase (carboxylating)
MVRWRRPRRDPPDLAARLRRGLAERDAGADADPVLGLEPEPSEVTPVRSVPLDTPLWSQDAAEAPPADVPLADDEPARPRPLLPPRPKWADIPPPGAGTDGAKPALAASEVDDEPAPAVRAESGSRTPLRPAAAPRRPQGRGGGGPLPGDAELDRAALVAAGRQAVRLALEEDLDLDGDVTSLATVPPDAAGRADLVARAEGVIAGTALVVEVFDQLDPRVTVKLHVEDGDRVRSGQQLGQVVGPLRSILTGERTALNFLTHLSGIATRARAFADAVDGTGCVIRDTRKTTPGLRLLEKAAVRAGGATNHRIGLYDALLVKDNHVAAAGSVAEATRRAHERAGGRHVQVEVRSAGELEEAVAAGARDVLLDNLDPEATAAAVARCRELEAEVGGRILLESSGRVTLETVRRYADAGVDRAAVGALTHSAPQLDIALDLRGQRPPDVRLAPSPTPGRVDADSLFDPPTDGR